MKYGAGMEGGLLPAWSDEEPRDLLDALLAPHDADLAELKPLPPFTGYTGHLSINGIPGHHYHAIAQRLPEENNNYATGAAFEHDVVSSSTAAPDARSDMLGDEPQPKTEMYDISSIEDIAAIIGSAIADTTVPSQPDDPDRDASRDSWMDLDAWIEGACGAQQAAHDALAEFSLPHSPPRLADSEARAPDLSKGGPGSTLQTLLTHGYMPLLQNRLQNGPPVKQELPSSTSFGLDAISTSSPPGNAVSTTDSLLLSGRYVTHHYALGLKADGLCGPDHLLGANFPHTTTVTPLAGKSKRSRCAKKAGSAHAAGLALQNAVEGLGGLLGKEKPVHRCNICNRGFLNKSNIKVHLRTHTGEKPFRCEVCAKAFRQKAHLIKHQQIHKRIGRD